MKDELVALAAGCEAASGHDAWLDGKIAEVAGWSLAFRHDAADDEVIHDVWTSPDGKRSRSTPPAFTASLDAAMSLVPQDWNWCAGTDGASGGHAFLRPDPFGSEIEAGAATPALALCAASLRARANQEK